jgi:hypothetical protein
MELLPYQEVTLIIGALIVAWISYKRRGWMSVLVWLQIAVYYALVLFDALSQDTRHIYGRINMLAIMSSEIAPYIMARFMFWRENRR